MDDLDVGAGNLVHLELKPFQVVTLRLSPENSLTRRWPPWLPGPLTGLVPDRHCRTRSMGAEVVAPMQAHGIVGAEGTVNAEGTVDR